jgi:hypothetical protein
MTIAGWILAVLACLAIAAGIWLLDRLALWLEARGLLFYRVKKPTSSPLSGLVAMHQAIEPGIRHVVQANQESRSDASKAASKERLLALLLATLRDAPANPEVIRAYLSRAKSEGLDWAALYREALQQVRSAASDCSRPHPLPESVTPD